MDEQKSSVSADGSGENSGTEVHQPFTIKVFNSLTI